MFPEKGGCKPVSPAFTIVSRTLDVAILRVLTARDSARGCAKYDRVEVRIGGQRGKGEVLSCPKGYKRALQLDSYMVEIQFEALSL